MLRGFGGKLNAEIRRLSPFQVNKRPYGFLLRVTMDEITLPLFGERLYTSLSPATWKMIKNISEPQKPGRWCFLAADKFVRRFIRSVMPRRIKRIRSLSLDFPIFMLNGDLQERRIQIADDSSACGIRVLRARVSPVVFRKVKLIGIPEDFLKVKVSGTNWIFCVSSPFN